MGLPDGSSALSGRATLFLCGDVMLGRGIDQVLPDRCPPRIYEPVLTSALDYVELAEEANGPIPRPVDSGWVWGAALDALEEVRPLARVVNLETSVTISEAALPKGINYRMHPRNVRVLAEAGVDCCVLANNHVLDWGEAGLLETLDTLSGAGLAVAGAGRDLAEAEAPAAVQLPGGGRLLVFGRCAPDSGVPGDWAAGPRRPGVCLLPDLSGETADALGAAVDGARRPGDLVVLSVHWGGNWGFAVPPEHRRFAHALVDRAGVDVVHGHSSHHPRGIEVYRGRLILYGCGDFLNDYEGISGHERFRGDLVLMYFPTLDPDTGELARLEMLPLQIRNFRLHPACAADRGWLRRTLDRECRRWGHRVEAREGRLELLRGPGR